MFDSNAYRKDVLKSLLDEEQRSFDDPFKVFGLDPAVDDVAAIRTRIDEVVAFWRKEQSSPRYKGLVTVLLKERETLASQLLDDRRRAECRARVVAGRDIAEQAKFAHLDEMLDALVRRHQGIPASRIERLRVVAKRSGVTDAEFDARLARRQVLDDEAAAVAPPPPAVRQQARSLLAEHARLQEGTQPVAHRTLFDFLGETKTSSPEAVRHAIEAMSARNRQRRHDRLRTVTDELLALATDLLVEGDRASYLAGLSEDVGDQLRQQIETAVLLEDRLSPIEFERLLQTAITMGLEPTGARTLLVRIAKDVGAPIETGVAVNYVVCGACAAACDADAGGRCLSCGEEIWRNCPSCGRQSARSAARCQGCNLDLRALGEAEAELTAVRASLDDGHVADARWRLEALEQWAGALPEVADLRRRVDATEQEASELWARLADLRAGRRFDDARHVVGRLRERAADLSGPGGESLLEVSEQIDGALVELSARVAAALDADPAVRESSILELVTEYPDSAAVLAALRSVPVAAPSRVMARLGMGTITVMWKASPSRGDLTYRVFRSVHDDDGGVVTKPIGSTSGTEIEDAGVVPGTVVTYEVQANRQGITSGSAVTSPLQAAFDVDRLAAIEHDGAIELRWTRLPGVTIWAERTDRTDPSAATRRMRSGESGVMDTDVVADHSYTYRVFVEYPSRGSVVSTSGREIGATAVVVPEPPTITSISTSGRTIRIVAESAGGNQVMALRCESAPATPPGTVLAAAAVARVGRVLSGAGGAFSDVADGPPRWYQLASVFGAQAVLGEVVEHPGFGDLSDLRVDLDGGVGAVLRWQWPAGCTEVMVAWRVGQPPTSIADPAASTKKVTNTSYDIAGGWHLAELPRGEVHFLVRPAARASGRIFTMPGSPDSARAMCAETSELSYRLRRAGRRKRNLEIEVLGGETDRPELYVVGRAGTASPSSADDGSVLGMLSPGSRSLAVPLDDLDLPVVVALFPAPGHESTIRIAHPVIEERTIT